MAGRDETFDGPQPGLALHAQQHPPCHPQRIRHLLFLRGNEPYKYSFGVEENRIKSFVLATKTGKISAEDWTEGVWRSR